MKEIYALTKPDKPLPLVFDSPHSGSIIPDDFDFACDLEDIQHTEDKFVEELFACAPDFGASLLCAHFPRSYIDPNRAPCDIDPGLLEEDWPFDPINPTARSDAGIGLIRRLVKPGVPVYDRPLSAEEIVHRIEKYYKPYHQMLEDLIEDAHYNFGQVFHINCHSMPATSAKPKQPIGITARGAKAVDFCLGDRDGTSCDIDFTHALRDFIKDLGHTVTINDPFKGVELTSRYSNPERGRHSLQLEINKALYMDEKTQEKGRNFYVLKRDIRELIHFCAEYTRSQLTDLAAD